VAESLACGTPVIAYDAGGPSELISHGENGCLIKSNEDFYEIVMKIYKNGYSSALRKNARESSNFFQFKKAPVSLSS
jgi:glycosyltransferase involved in cell wall biosynthesis